jgi:hypothetical protein
MLPIDRNGVGNAYPLKTMTQNVVFTITSFEFQDFPLNPVLSQPSRNCFNTIRTFEKVKLMCDRPNFLMNLCISPVF